jgi:O-antigen/teichoic acid export membrane protein
LKHSFFYFIGYIVSRSQVFFLVPILVRFLNKEDLGVYEILSSLNIFILMLVIFSLDACLLSFYSEQKDFRQKSEVFCASIALSGLIGLIVLVVAYFGRGFFLKALLLHGEINNSVFLMSVAAGVLSAWTQIFLVLFRLRFESLKFAFVTVLGPLLSIGLTFFLLIKNPQIESVFYASLLSSVMTFILSIVSSKKSFIWVSPNFKYWMPRLLKIVLPLIPFSFSAWMLNLADREILVKLRGFSEAGIYGVLSKISNLTGILLGPFQIAWSPYAMAFWEKGHDVKRGFLKVFKYFFICSFVIVFFVFIFSDFLIKVFSDSSYLEFSYLLAPLSICNVLGVAYYFPLVSFLKEKKMLGSTVAFSVGALLNILLNFALIPVLGILGSVVANLIGYGTMLLVAGSFESSLTKIGYFYKRIVFVSLLISLFILFLGKHYFYLNFFERMIFVLLLVSLFVGFIYFFKNSTKKDLVYFFKYFKSRIKAR